MNSILKHTPKLVLAALMVTLSGTTMSSVATTKAAFTDTATASSANFTTGTVNLSVKTGTGTINCTTGGPISTDDSASVGAVFTTTSKPGDLTVTAVCLENFGTLPLTWGLATPTFSGEVNRVAGGSLALKGTLKGRVTTPATPATACVASLTAAGADTGSETTVGASAVLTSLTVPAGVQALTAAGGATPRVKLCFTFNIPSGTADDFDQVSSIQGSSFDAAFLFAGTNS